MAGIHAAIVLGIHVLGSKWARVAGWIREAPRGWIEKVLDSDCRFHKCLSLLSAGFLGFRLGAICPKAWCD